MVKMVKNVNLSLRPVILKRNSKIADVSPCVAVEDFYIQQSSCKMLGRKQYQVVAATEVNFKERL